MGRASNPLMNVLWKSCIEDVPIPNTSQGLELLEAHLFTTVQVNRDVQEMVLSKKLKLGPNGEDRTPHWNTILANARAWCRRNNVTLTQV